jgi:thiopeptide-type bacteriocin biosynthesis protein
MTDQPLELAHAGGFALRSPALPAAAFAALTDDLRSYAFAADAVDPDEADVAQVAEAAAADQATLAGRLKELLADPVVREGIYIASPNLDERITAWLAGDDSEERSLVRSTLAYVARMSTRSTPFGLFAGCTAGTVGDTTELALGSPDSFTRHTRLDYGFLSGVLRRAVANPALQRELRFRPNSGLYRAGGRLRLAEERTRGGRVSYQRVAFDEDDVLASILDRAAAGATLHELAATLVDDDVTEDDALEYLGELVDAQLIVPDAQPAITGDEPVPDIVARLEATTSGRTLARALASAQEAIEQLDRKGVGNDPGAYREIGDSLKELDAELDLSQLFQVDLVKPSDRLQLDEGVIAELSRAVGVLQRIGNHRPPGDLDRFREAFLARYEDREVPLLEALDEEVGVGFGGGPDVVAEAGPLLAGLPAAGRSGGGATWEATDRHRLQLLLRSVREGLTELELTDDDVDALSSADAPGLPDAMSVMATIVGRSAEAVGAGDYRILLRNVVGPSGARMLGRFCHADAEIEVLVRRHLAQEEALRPDAVFAEVVHLSDGRIGNVLARPVLREYEITFHGESGAPADRQLPASDLLVSVVGRRIVLRSKRLGCEVIPRLTSAHNYGGGALVPYQFLGMLQHQGVSAGMGFSWGPLDSVAFLPRVTYGKLILSRARWAVPTIDLKGALESKSTADRFLGVQRVRRERNIPRWVAIAAGDNELVIDLSTFAGCESLLHEAKRLPMLPLLELVPSPDELCVDTPAGPVFHELVVPLARVATTGARPHAHPGRAAAAARHHDRGGSAIDETFAPGSAWLTAKLYTGKATTDGVLRELVAPVVHEVTSRGLASGWFFLRYGDPDWHVRLRLHGEPEALWGRALPLLRAASEPFMADGRVANLQLDTYRRETARYGGPQGMLVSERVFTADSEAVLAAMATLDGGDDGDARWRLAVLGVDRLLQDMGLDLAARQRAVRMWRDGLVEEYGRQGVAAKQHGGKVMRKERKDLEALLLAPQTTSLAPAAEAFALRSRANVALADELRSLHDAGLLTGDITVITASYSHMFVNRLLRAGQRLQELVVYDLLDRLYSSQLHRRGTP